jgi:nucleotide-binding universal stress UspA family protein
MAGTLKPGWSKPSTILFASDSPPNERVFGFALAQAAEFSAELIIFHAYGDLYSAASEASAFHSNDSAKARAEKHRLESLAQRARDLRIYCSIVVRPGLPAMQILAYLCERKIDRVVMGTRSPGPVGKLLVGSVAEAVLRKANVPVCFVGPNVVEGTFRITAARKVICDVSKHEASRVVADFGAELAVRHNASLILHQAIAPQESDEVFAGRSIEQVQAELASLVPVKLKRKVKVRSMVTLGDPTGELLYQARTQQANLIVLSANDASHIAAISLAGTVYKLLAFAHCPVITLSPVVLAGCDVQLKKLPPPPEINYMAGLI